MKGDWLSISAALQKEGLEESLGGAKELMLSAAERKSAHRAHDMGHCDWVCRNTSEDGPKSTNLSGLEKN